MSGTERHRFKDKAFVITGGSSGIGLATARRLLRAGATVKGAMRSLVRVLAREFAPRRITVIGLSPGPIDPGFAERTGMDTEAQTGFREKIAAKVPLGRMGTADEAAAVAAFLLSGEASFVTGPEYVVDGGVTEL